MASPSKNPKEEVPGEHVLKDGSPPNLESGSRNGDESTKVNDVNSQEKLPLKRPCKKTEVSREFHMGIAKKNCERLMKRLLRHEKLMSILMQSIDNKEKMVHESNEYDKTFSELVASYTRFMELTDEDNEFVNLQKSLSEIDSSVFDFKEKIYTWISEIKDECVVSEKAAPSLKSQRTNHSRTSHKKAASVHSDKTSSSKSRHSERAESVHSHKTSSSRSKYSSKASTSSSVHSNCSRQSYLDHRAEAAGLRAEASVLKRKREAELEAELLEFDQKIQRAEAMGQVYKEMVDLTHGIKGIHLQEDGGIENKSKKQRKEEKGDTKDKGENVVIREKRRKEKKHKSRKVKETSSRSFNETLLEVLQLQSAPKVDMDVFSGEVLEYQYFIETFREVVERVIPDERGRLTRLIQYTSGEPKELIRHCIHDDPGTCYTHAMDLLKNQYGDPHRIATAYLKELRQWPKLKQHDAKSFRLFYHFLIKCKIYKKKGQFLNELDSTDNLRCLVKKLPTNLQDKWNRRVDSIKVKDERCANFEDFSSFIDTESRIVNNPVFSQEALQEHNNIYPNNINTKSMATGVNEHMADDNSLTCQMCSGEHDLDDCEKYKKLARSARVKFLYEKKLCYACYGDAHKADSCTQKRSCTVCSEEHPAGLHKYEITTPLPSRSTVQHHSSKSEVVSMCVIPVRMSHKDHPEKEVSVYAVLDDCSKGTFILENVLSELDLPGVQPTSLTLKTMTGSATENSNIISGLIVKCSLDHESYYPYSTKVELPIAYTRNMIPVEEDEIPTPERVRPWKHLAPILEKLPSFNSSMPIGLLIGANCPKALEPHEVIPSADNGPYAIRSQLGWCVVGPLESEELASTAKTGNNSRIASRKTAIDISTNSLSKHHFAVQKEMEDTSIKEMLVKIYESEFIESNSEKRSLSQEDHKFMSIMTENCQLVNGRYQLPLPFRSNHVTMPYNKRMAIQRLEPLKRKFHKNPKFKEDYCEFMGRLIEKGYAQMCEIESCEDSSQDFWFIPHHGVYHPQKPDKFRTVFDCAARYKGVSLNSELLSGPDLGNLLIGVFLRFRKEEVPFMADIESMFYQVGIPPEQRRFVRFLWWPDGDPSSDAREFEMCAHLFGAVSSPGVANFALKKCASDCREKFGEEAFLTMTKNFYVDDLLKSESTEEAAADIASKVDKICASVGFNLTKFVSSSDLVLSKLPPEKLVKFIDDLNIPANETILEKKVKFRDDTNIPVIKETIERALGVIWCVERDVLRFRITLQDNPLNRRGMLRSISTIYDPDGNAAVFLLEGRKILQETTSKGGGWDDKVAENFALRWGRWRDELMLLGSVEIPRCFKPHNFGEVADISLHTFSDASERGYGKCSYLRQVSKSGEIHVSLVMGKSRVTPLKEITIPRLELAAATLGSKIHAMLKEELMIVNLKSMFWVDSKIVLGYILNETRRFRTYVANRVQKITSLTQKSDWNYVDTKANPADYCSRGISPSDRRKVKAWFMGPGVLWTSEDEWEKEDVITEYPPNDKEVKEEKELIVNSTVVEMRCIVETLETRVSTWSRMKRVSAWIQRFAANCKEGAAKVEGSLDVESIAAAERTLLRLVQDRHHKSDISILKGESRKLPKTSTLRRLDPFIDSNNILRVGGRLSKGELASEIKFPVIIPKKSMVGRRIVEWCHMMVEHRGRTTTFNEIRCRGYWIVNCTALVKSVINKCVKCRELRGRFGQQKMADLPKERIEPEAPFTYCGVDLFGPFYVKEGRKEMKRYGTLFTCFSLRAIHIEVSHSLTTDSFILALRRFIARRGAVRSIRSDNGTNFVGADNEFKKAVQEMDDEKIETFLTENGCDWISWKRNPPTASHMGGVWERLIRSVRDILDSLLKHHAHILNDESLHTLLLEAEAIVNSRPLTVDNIGDPNTLPLSPTQLLTFKSKLVLPPPGVFQKEDLYARKRWRRVQHLANEFWKRWRKEYLSSLQTRQKWDKAQRNFQVGDIVLLRDDDKVRNHWPRGVVTEAFPDSKGLVRTVTLRVANNKTPVTRPIAKLVLLVESDSK